MFARTERLLLRPGWIEDAPALVQAIGDEGIARNLARLPWPYTLVHAETYLSQPVDSRSPSLLVFARTSGRPLLVGGVGIHPDQRGHELGYWISRPFWGLGYATEAAGALLRAARETLRLERVVSAHFADNPASGRVLRKLGFRPTGTMVRRHCMARGAEVDCVLFEDAGESDLVSPVRCLQAA